MTKTERNWALYDWANSAYTVAIMTAILPIFFKDVVAKEMDKGMSTAYWGYANSSATLVLAFLAPILGTIADYNGYKKRFLTAFLVLGVIFTTLMSTIGPGNWALCLAFYVLATIGFFGSNVFYDAFLIDVTEEERMDWVSSMGYGLGYIGSTIPFIFNIIIITKPSIIGLQSSITATQVSFIITALWWILFSLPILTGVKQTHYIEPSKHPIKESFLRLFQTLKDVKGHKNIFLFLIAYFFYIDGVSTIINMSAAFGIDIGVSSKSLMVILLATQFAAFPFALLYGKLAKIFSAKRMLMVGISVYILITVLAFFIKTTLHFWVLAMLVATSQGGIQALSRSIFGKLIPKEKSSEFFGIYDIFGKFSAVMGPFLVAIFTQMTGTSRFGVLSLIILFTVGAYMLTKVNTQDIKKANTSSSATVDG